MSGQTVFWIELTATRFVTHSTMKTCIQHLNAHYRRGIGRNESDAEVNTAEFGDVVARSLIKETYTAGGQGRRGMVAVWNQLEI